MKITIVLVVLVLLSVAQAHQQLRRHELPFLDSLTDNPSKCHNWWVVTMYRSCPNSSSSWPEKFPIKSNQELPPYSAKLKIFLEGVESQNKECLEAWAACSVAWSAIRTTASWIAPPIRSVEPQCSQWCPRTTTVEDSWIVWLDSSTDQAINHINF